MNNLEKLFVVHDGSRTNDLYEQLLQFGLQIREMNAVRMTYVLYYDPSKFDVQALKQDLMQASVAQVGSKRDARSSIVDVITDFKEYSLTK